jgi:hypothetical protein
MVARATLLFTIFDTCIDVERIYDHSPQVYESEKRLFGNADLVNLFLLISGEIFTAEVGTKTVLPWRSKPNLTKKVYKFIFIEFAYQ